MCVCVCVCVCVCEREREIVCVCVCVCVCVSSPITSQSQSTEFHSRIISCVCSRKALTRLCINDYNSFNKHAVLHNYNKNKSHNFAMKNSTIYSSNSIPISLHYLNVNCLVVEYNPSVWIQFRGVHTTQFALHGYWNAKQSFFFCVSCSFHIFFYPGKLKTIISGIWLVG